MGTDAKRRRVFSSRINLRALDFRKNVRKQRVSVDASDAANEVTRVVMAPGQSIGEYRAVDE